MKIRQLLRRRFAQIGGAAAVLAIAGVLQFADANPAVSQNLSLTAYAADKDPGLDPNNGAWNSVPWVQLPLTAQAGSYAAGGGSIPVVNAKALHYQGNLFVRLEWQDSTKDETTTRVQDFSDAAAIEFPAVSAASVPSVCMGQANAGVNIWQWRADSQAGLKDPADVYVNALVDGYPSKEPLFYTARAAGNPYADPAIGPVQTLVAQAFGTLSKANVQDATGGGVWQNGAWSVVFSRPFAGADPQQANFSPGTTTDMAVAVWNGSDGDRNGRKSVSTFVKLNVATVGAPGAKATNNWGFVAAGVLLVAFIGLGVGLGVIGYRQTGRR